VNRALYWQLAGFYFFYFGYLGAFAPYFSLYLDALGFGAALIGAVLAVPQVMRIFASHLWGYLADRSGHRVRVSLVTGVLGTLAFLGVFLGSGTWWLLLCIVLWSFFWSAALPLMETTCLDHLGTRPGDYGRIRLWGSVGFIVAVVGVGWVLDVAGTGTLLWIIAGSMAGILLCLGRVPEVRHDEVREAAEPIVNVLKRPDVIALIAACFLMAVAHGPYYTFFSLHLVDHGYSKTQVGWMWALGVIAEIMVFACLPWFYRVCSVRGLLIWSFALAVVRFVIIGWFADALIPLVVAQLMHAATFGTFHSAALASVHRWFKGRNQARGQAVYSSLSFGLGGTLGGLASGVAWERLGASLTFGAAAGCALVGLAILMMVRERHARGG
jgi:PPP family 3-phenylpropionic acid transporter